MKLYDALLVNTIIEGMNLVAKEGPVVNDRNGVLILSATSGVHHQLWPRILRCLALDRDRLPRLCS